MLIIQRTFMATQYTLQKLCINSGHIANTVKSDQWTFHSLDVATLMRSFLSILPDAFLGISVTNATFLTFL